MQALGAFGKLGLFLGKVGFRSAIPYALANLRHLALHADALLELPALRTLFLDVSERLRDTDFQEITVDSEGM